MNRKKDKKMAAIIAGFTKYEGSKKSYCERHNIKPHVFDYYRKKIDETEVGNKFIPIQLEPLLSFEKIELHYPNGNHLCLSLDIPMSVLKELIQMETPKSKADV